MPVVGEGVIEIVSDASGFSSDLTRQTEGPLNKAGTGMMRVLGTSMKRAAQFSMATVGSIVAVALVKGFGRLKAIDQAKVKLEGLGHSGKDITKIMGNALASVKGTAFGLGDAATLAASVVAAGVKPGKDLERTLKLTADTATIAGTSMSDMGAIFGKVAARGKLSGDELAQLTDRGIPALQFLSKTLGKSTADVQGLVTGGKIDFATFQKAMEAGVGGAAKASGKSFTGAMENIKAALGRAGASVLESSFNQMPDMFATAIGWVDKLAPLAKNLGTVLGNAFARGWAALQKLVSSPEGQAFLAGLLQTAKDLGTIFSTVIVPVFQNFLGMFTTGGGSGLVLVQQILSWIADNGPLVAKVIYGVVAGLSAWRTATLLLNAANAVMIAQQQIMAAGGLVKFIQGIVTSTKLWTVAQWLLNLAMDANPIGIVILAIVGLIAVIVLLWKNSETFRGVVLAVWAAIQSAIAGVIAWFSSSVVPFFQKLWAGIVAGATWLWSQLTGIWAGVVSVFDAVKNKFLEVATSIAKFYATWIAPVFQLFAAIVAWLWNRYVSPYLNWIISLFVRVGNYFHDIWVKVISWVFNQLRAGFRAVGDLFTWVYNKVISPVIGFFGRRLNELRVGFDIVKNAIRAGWNWLAGQLQVIYEKNIRPVVDAMKRGIDLVKQAFNAAKDGIKKAWEAIADAAKRPIRFVIDTVMNKGIIDNFNKLARTFHTTELPQVKLPPGFLHGGPTRNVGRRKVAGVVHGNEHVITDEEVRRTPGGHGTWERLRGMARAGMLPGFLDGGKVTIGGKTFTKTFASTIAAAQNLAGYAFNIFQGGFRPATSYSGTSHQKDALDFGPVTAKSVKSARKAGIAAWDRTGMGNWMPHIHGVPLPGYGTPGGSAVWQALNYLAGGNGLGGKDNGAGSGYRPIPAKLTGAALNLIGQVVVAVIDWTKKLADSLAAPLRGLTDKVLDNPLGRVAIGMVNKVVEEMKKKIFGKKPDEQANAGGVSTAGVSGSAQAQGKALLARMGFSDDQWPPLKKLWNKESGWNVHASNKSSGAYGIPQSLPGSKMASAGPDWRNNAATQIAWGLSYIKQRYGNPLKAWAHSQATNWYDGGGFLPPGLSLAMNGTGKPERVRTAAQEAALGGDTYNIDVMLSLDDLSRIHQLDDFLKVLGQARVQSRKSLRSGLVAA